MAVYLGDGWLAAIFSSAGAVSIHPNLPNAPAVGAAAAPPGTDFASGIRISTLTFPVLISSGADLSNADLSYANLRNDASGSDLSRAMMCEVTLVDCSFRRATFVRRRTFLVEQARR
jgi:uncharacterized protein YjbI with pentapeptide repeats